MADEHSNDPDLDLLPAAARGDLDAFEALVRRYQHRVVSLARTLTGSPDEAEDLAQEVFVRVYKSLGAFRGDSLFRTWLYTVTVNVSRSHHARKRRQQDVWADSGADDDMPFDPPDTDDFEGAWLTRDAVARALERLPADQRTVVTLRDVHGLDYREIAEMLGIPMGTVESRIARGRSRLRAVLRPAAH